MISAAAWRRMRDLVNDAEYEGAQIVRPGSGNETFTAENRVYPPTLVLESEGSMRVMQEEIFGPILPIVTYSSFDEAIAFINAQSPPTCALLFRPRQSPNQESLGADGIRGRDDQ